MLQLMCYSRVCSNVSVLNYVQIKVRKKAKSFITFITKCQDEYNCVLHSLSTIFLVLSSGCLFHASSRLISWVSLCSVIVTSLCYSQLFCFYEKS